MIIMDIKTRNKIALMFALSIFGILMLSSIQAYGNVMRSKTERSEACSRFLSLKKEIDAQVFIKNDLAAELAIMHKRYGTPFNEAGDQEIEQSFLTEYKSFTQLICK